MKTANLPDLPRHLLATALDRLSYYPGVVLLGPRQVGKTTLAKEIAAHYPGSVFLDMERAADRAQLQGAEAFFAAHRNRLVVLDEVQAMPDIFEALRPEIDAQRSPGRFLLLGSASGKLLRQSAESLAGRVSYLELQPLLANEIMELVPSRSPQIAGQALNDEGLLALQRLLLRGGFPPAYTASSDARSMQWRQDMIQTFLQRDLPQLGVTIASSTLHRVWRMLAHNHGQIFNAAQIGQALGGVSHTTIGRYLDLFVDAMMLRRLQPLHVNLGKRLVKSPKVYVRDSGLLHALLGIGSIADLQGHAVVGASWEGIVVEHVMAAAPTGSEVNFYRTAAGAEIDVVITMGDKRLGFEAKFSSAPKPTHSFKQSGIDLGLQHNYLVAPVRQSYPIASNASVIALNDIARVIADAQ